MQRVCVIGLGPIGNRHADLYKEDPLAELIAVCDVRRDRADAAAKRLGVSAFYDVRQMLADRFHIEHVTLQVEHPDHADDGACCSMDPRCLSVGLTPPDTLGRAAGEAAR